MNVLVHHIDRREGPDGHPVVAALVDLVPVHVTAALHALRVVREARYRTVGLSVDEVLAMRDLTSLVDELAELAGADGIVRVQLSVARLAVLSDGLDEFSAGLQFEREGDAEARPIVYWLCDALADVRADAVRAALEGVSPANC